MELQTRIHTYTPEEYLELEETAVYKSEYRDGEIIPMTGGTGNHNKITLAIAAILLYAMRRKNNEVFMGDMRLWIP
ncbi:MAG: Uma2 family endonuclease [Anabaena sp. 49633_E8]|nr:Uma2 family endonuclease [Anabaena sp. 49633_E8]